jgi:hypothetical protein
MLVCVGGASVEQRWIAACGLDCKACDIRRIPLDDSALETCAAWFREMGWLKANEGKAEILDRGMYCTGCKGDRSIHWSVDAGGRVTCWILECCVDRKGLAFCSECSEFPCERLVTWSRENESYASAFARLESMHSDARRA